MNRFTLLSALLLVFSINIFSQGAVVLPTQNSYKLHTYTGSFLEAKAYAGGVAFLGNDGTDDFSAYSIDGETFSVAETFTTGTGSLLSAWSNNSIGFYQGGENFLTNINQNVIADGVPAMISDYQDNILTEIVHMNYGDLGGGDLGDRYYFCAKGDNDPSKGDDLVIWEYNPYTGEVGMVDDDAGFMKNYVVFPGMNSGRMEHAVLNNKLYSIFSLPVNSFLHSVVVRFDFDPTGVNATKAKLLWEFDSETISLSDLQAMGDYLYVIRTFGDDRTTDYMYAINEAGEAIAVSGELGFAPYRPVVAGDRMYAIQQTNDYKNVKKLAVIDGPDQVRIVHINAETENDSIDNITIGGDKVFFTAKTPAGTYGLYAMLIEDDNAQPALVKDFGSESVENITGIPNGVAYSMYVGGDSYFIFASDGFESADYMLHRGVEDGSFSWGDIESMVVNGDILYVCEADTFGNINIWSHDINDVTRAGCDVQFTVVEEGSTTAIPGANLTLFNDFYSYTGTTDAAGQVIFMDLPYANSFKEGWGTRNYRYDLEASGYQSVIGGTMWLNTGAQEVTLTMTEDDPNGIEDVDTEFKVFPTYVTNQLTIQTTQNIQRVGIYNISGARVMDINAPAGNTIDVSTLTSGIYVIVIEGTNVQETSKFIKK